MKFYRILLTCEDFFPHVGGAEVCVANLKRELSSFGHHVVLYTNTMAKTPDDDALLVRVPWSFSVQGLWKNVRTLWELVADSDIVHCQYSFRLAAICAIICFLQRKPMVLTQQGKGIVAEAHSRWHHALLIRVCQVVSMRGATIITSTSDEITDLTAAFVPRSKIVSVTNGYDAATFQPDDSVPVPPEYQSISEGVKTLLTVRRLVPKNGIHILVQALALVRDKNPDFHYFAIGEGRTEGFILELVRKYGLEKHVTLLGKKPNDQIRSYLQHADLVLIPSSAEATSIACIEAMGMQKPLIASRVGGLIDLLGTNSEYGLLVPIYDSEACTYDPPDTLPPERLQALADAILSFLRDPNPFYTRAVAARQKALESYSWTSIAKRYQDLYDQYLLPSLT